MLLALGGGSDQPVVQIHPAPHHLLARSSRAPLELTDHLALSFGAASGTAVTSPAPAAWLASRAAGARSTCSLPASCGRPRSVTASPFAAVSSLPASSVLRAPASRHASDSALEIQTTAGPTGTSPPITRTPRRAGGDSLLIRGTSSRAAPATKPTACLRTSAARRWRGITPASRSSRPSSTPARAKSRR